jgi:hypothetical protein
MKTGKFNFKKLVVLGGTSVFTLLAVPLVADLAFDGSRALLATAHAADGVPAGSGQGGTSGGAQQGQGGSSSGAGRTTDAAGAGQAGGTSGGAQQGQGASTSGGTSGSSAKGPGGASGGASKATDGAATSGTGSMGSGARGQGSSQDNKQQGGGSAPGPGGINNEPNDAKGPRFSGGAGTGSSGGKPAWAQEGLPTNPDGTEVELGRLNVVRAPGKLLDKQLIEATAALADLVAGGGSLYQSADLAAALTLISQDVVRIDSPLENLALLKDFLSDGVIDGNYVTTDGTTNQLLDPAMPDADFVSLLLGSAADKTVPITAGTVGAMEVLLGLDLGDNAAIAESADAVRKAILDAHED